MKIKTASESSYSKIDWITTGISSLDKILGGGIPTKRITELSGPFSVGKTTLALTVIGNAQKQGLKTLWIDQEWAWESSYAEVLGVDPSKLLLIQERYAELALDQLEEFAENNKNAVIVLDAVGALLPRQEAEKSNEGKTIGGQAGLVAKFLRKIVPLLAINNHALLLCNHQFIDLMTSRLKTSGGAKLEYHKSIWLSLRKANKKIMNGENQVGLVVEAEIKKNKLTATQGQKCELQMIFGEGFSKEADLLQDALDSGLITKQGQFYFFRGEKVARGLNALREKFKDENFREQLKA